MCACVVSGCTTVCTMRCICMKMIAQSLSVTSAVPWTRAVDNSPSGNIGNIYQPSAVCCPMILAFIIVVSTTARAPI